MSKIQYKDICAFLRHLDFRVCVFYFDSACIYTRIHHHHHHHQCHHYQQIFRTRVVLPFNKLTKLTFPRTDPAHRSEMSANAYVSSVDVHSQFADLKLCKTDRLSAEPVTLRELVCEAVQTECVVKRVVDDMLWEYTNATAEHPAVIYHTNVCTLINIRRTITIELSVKLKRSKLHVVLTTHSPQDR